MKKIFNFIAALTICTSVFGQSPEKMSYQAVVRNSGGDLVSSTTIGMQVSILQGSTTGSSVYVETQSPSSNSNGLVSIEIGSGTVVSGDFSSIDWTDGPYFIKTETDPTGGSNYTISGTSELLSVPFSLHAKTADSLTSTYPENDPIYGASIANGIQGSDTAYWNNHTIDTDTQLDSSGVANLGYVAGAHTVEVDGDVTNELQALSISNDTIYLANGGFVKLPIETDPSFNASLASNISSSDTINWSNHTVDTDTQLDSTGVANLGYVAGAHTVEIDGSVTNELQILSLSNDTLYIQDGNYVYLGGIKDTDWSQSGNYVYNTTDSVGIGTSTPGARLEVSGHISQTGIGNSVFIGESAGINDDLSNNQNVFIGYQSGATNTTGDKNSATGYQALYSNTTGTQNTANGYLALFYNTNGAINTAMGYQALYSNATSSGHVAIGNQALFSNTTGLVNVAIGTSALYTNTSGKFNVATGHEALNKNTIGDENTAIGFQSLYSNISGSRNNALGYSALYNNTTGYQNSAFGHYALYSNTTGYSNSAFGYRTLYFNTSGRYNVASGMDALYSNTSGTQNTAIGHSALYKNTSGGQNIAVGIGAMYNNTTGSANAAVGNQALANNITGFNNTAIGRNAFWSGTAYSNSSAVGYFADISASNQIRLGNSSVTSIGGYSGWSNLSDGRYKKNVKEDVIGLDFIMDLRPVTYNLDITKLNTALGIKIEDDEFSARSISEKEAIIQSGFIAQEVEKSAEKLGYEFSGVDKPKNGDDHYSLRYAEFVVPLVKATQEQQEQIEKQQEQIEELKALVKALELKLD